MLTDNTSMVTHMTVMNTRVEMRKLLNENTQTIIDTQINWNKEIRVSTQT